MFPSGFLRYASLNQTEGHTERERDMPPSVELSHLSTVLLFFQVTAFTKLLVSAWDIDRCRIIYIVIRPWMNMHFNEKEKKKITGAIYQLGVETSSSLRA